jgi:hypothetical protein
MRDRGHPKNLPILAFGIDSDYRIDGLPGEKRLQGVCFVVGHRQEQYALVMELIRKLIQVGNRVDAGRTPGRPKLQNDDFATEATPLPIESVRCLEPLGYSQRWTLLAVRRHAEGGGRRNKFQL